MRTALLTATALAIGGLFGAALFNPDMGLVIRSEPVWRAFGLASYLGWALLPLLALIALARVALQELAHAFQRDR